MIVAPLYAIGPDRRGGAALPGRQRLPKSQREQLIVAEAIRFFAEVGFEGQTRALAQRLGVTQPLLYRYFPDKEALIDRVCREVFVDGWNDDWTRQLVDRSKPLIERMVTFYRSYTQAMFSYERVRLLMFAGLKDKSVASRYMAHVRDCLFVPLCQEIRADLGVERAEPVTPREVELVAGLHGAVGYVGVRHWGHQILVPDDIDVVVEQLVRTYMSGIPDAFRRLAAG